MEYPFWQASNAVTFGAPGGLLAASQKQYESFHAFGWDPMPTVTDADRVLLEEIDVRTDQIMAAHYSILSEDEISAFAATAEAIAAVCEGSVNKASKAHLPPANRLRILLKVGL